MKRKHNSRYFWDNVQIGHYKDCWEWQGGRNPAGYGMFRKDGKNMLAHRVAYDLAKFGIPSGKIICHTCDNPPCCNPGHLYAGTQKDNVRDRYAREKENQVIAVHMPNKKLTWKKVRDIRESEKPPSVLAREHNVSYPTIHNILMGFTWVENG